MNSRKLLVGVAAAGAVAAAAFPFAPHANATPASHVQAFSIPFTFDLDVTIDCQHSGDTVNINGPIGLGGSAAHVWYQNNVKGTHQTPVYSGILEAALTPQNGSVHLVKQPSKTNADGQPGSGGNPWIWYDADAAGSDYAPVLVGRCVSQSYNVNKHVTGSHTVTANLIDTVQALDCSNSNAAVHLKHQQNNPQVDGELIFDNNVNKPTHPSRGAAHMTVGLADANSFSKDADLKAGMGNPLVYLTAGDTDADAQATQNNGGGLKLGRCNQLF